MKNEGVRISLIESDSGNIVTNSIDISNRNQPKHLVHFNYGSKKSYNSGTTLIPQNGEYSYITPIKPIPKIITSSTGNGNILAIKNYFTDEQVIRRIANNLVFPFDKLIGGKYKLLIEPIAYITFQGVQMAMTATECALYDQMLGGGVRRYFADLSHKNLPLSLFLETPDLGYPAWSGSRNSRVSNEQIISSLGLGIVKFKEQEPPEVDVWDYEYRVDTDVITAVTVSGGQADPDNPASVTFFIDGTPYRVGNVYYPLDGEQLVWVRWHTPKEPQVMRIPVSVSGGHADAGVITARIVDLSKNEPPDPEADDRNDGFRPSPVPRKPERTQASWGIWIPEWNEALEIWEFYQERYSAQLTSRMRIDLDEKNPTGRDREMKSGYGIHETVTARVRTDMGEAVTDVQNAVTYFPEFGCQTYWRLLDQTRSGEFQFKNNHYSTFNNRTHFSPIWTPDGAYTPCTGRSAAGLPRVCSP